MCCHPFFVYVPSNLFILHYLPILFMVFLYFFSLQVCNLNFFWVVCCHSFFVYVPSNLFYIAFVNLSLILKMPNCSFMSLLLFFLSQSVLYTTDSEILGFENYINNYSIKYQTGMRNSFVSRPKWKENPYLHLLMGESGQRHRRLT